MAPLRPWWASLITSWTPARPRATRPRRKASQKAPSSLGPTSSPSTSRSPVGRDADGDDHRHRDHPAVLAHLHEGGVQPHVRVGPGQRAGAEALHLRVQLLAQAADLALADALQPQRLDQVVHAPGARRPGRRPPGPPPPAPAPPAGGAPAGAGKKLPSRTRGTRSSTVPTRVSHVPLPVPVALPRPLGRALVALGPQVLRHLQLHQRLRRAPAPPPAGSPRRAPASALRSRSSSAILSSSAIVVGSSLGDLSNPDGNHTVADAVNGSPQTPHLPGLYSGPVSQGEAATKWWSCSPSAGATRAASGWMALRSPGPSNPKRYRGAQRGEPDAERRQERREPPV